METDLQKFRQKHKGNIKQAMHANNVIDEPFFDIPLDQVHFFYKKSWKLKALSIESSYKQKQIFSIFIKIWCESVETMAFLQFSNY